MNNWRGFYRQWIIANVIFTVIGITMGAFRYPAFQIPDNPASKYYSPGISYSYALFYGGLPGAMTGAVIGFAQRYLLEPALYLPSTQQSGRET